MTRCYKRKSKHGSGANKDDPSLNDIHAPDTISTMNRLFSIILISLALTMTACASKNHIAAPDTAAGPAIVSGNAKKDALQKICSGYSDWKSVSLSGKITSLNFIVKPSVKLYMNRGTEVLISVRVPLKGEVARLEADRDSILVINKLNRTYVHESLETLQRLADVTLSDIQDLFLGRVFLAGRGTLDRTDEKRVDIYSEQQGWLVVPSGQRNDSMVHYGFKTDEKGRVVLLMLTSLFVDATAQLDYSYSGKDSELKFTFDRDAVSHSISLELSAPKWNDKGFNRIGIIPSDYRQVSIRQFLRIKQ